MEKKVAISVQALIDAPVEKVWELYTIPKHIIKWNNASSDWHTPRAENDLKIGGKFSYRMESKDGSTGFDFNGIYEQVKENRFIAYTMEDGRKVIVNFTKEQDKTRVITVFEAENENPVEMQKEGWQSILNNFKKYVEDN